MDYNSENFSKDEKVRLFIRNIYNLSYKIAIEGTVINPNFIRKGPTGDKESGIEILADKKAVMKGGKFDLKKTPKGRPSRILYHNIYDVKRL